MTDRLSRADLTDIQALVIYRRPAPYFGSYILIRVDAADHGRRLLAHLLPHVPSVASWDPAGSKVCVAIAITYPGLAALGVDAASLATFPVQLRDGMAARAQQLADHGASDPSHWDQPFGTGQVHIALSIIAPTQAAWRQQVTSALDTLDRTGLTVLTHTEYTAHPGARTSLGYRDGISFPNISGLPSAPTTAPEPPIAAGEFVLGHPSETGQPLAMPQPDVLARNGSYIGLRKIRTDVAAFRRFLRDKAPNPADQQHLAAKLLGRWPSGAPLILSPDADDPALADDPTRINDFGYAHDPQGLICPHGAHIRRVNPRDSQLTTLTDVRVHRILRQGTVYGPPLPDGMLDDDGIDRGIIFMFISARPHALEFLKTQWLNDGSFIGLGTEQDPLAGNHDASDQYTIPDRPVRRRLNNLHSFTTTKGGEYAFLPSLSALTWLAAPGGQATT